MPKVADGHGPYARADTAVKEDVSRHCPNCEAMQREVDRLNEDRAGGCACRFDAETCEQTHWCLTHAKMRDERDKLRATLADAICMAQSQGSCLDEDDIKQITEWLTLLEDPEP